MGENLNKLNKLLNGELSIEQLKAERFKQEAIIFNVNPESFCTSKDGEFIPDDAIGTYHTTSDHKDHTCTYKEFTELSQVYGVPITIVSADPDLYHKI